MHVEFSFDLELRCAGATVAYPEVAPFAVSVHFRPTARVSDVRYDDLARRVPFHTRRFIVDTSVTPPRVHGALHVPIAALAGVPLTEASQIALTFYATSTSVDVRQDTRRFWQALGDASIQINALPNAKRSIFNRAMPFVDEAAQARLKTPIAKATIRARTSWISLRYDDDDAAPLAIVRAPSMRRADFDAHTERVLAEYRTELHRTLRPLIDGVKWMHFPEYVGRAGQRLPSPTLLLKRPSGAPSARLFELWLSHACAIMRTQEAYAPSSGRAIDESLLYDDVLTLLAVPRVSPHDATQVVAAPPCSVAAALEASSRLGCALVLAASLFAQHSVYTADHINVVNTPREHDSKTATFQMLERVRDCQEVGGTDCEDKAQHAVMTLAVWRETDWRRVDPSASPLVRYLTRYLRLVYAPALVNATATSASAGGATRPAMTVRDENAKSLLHTFGLLVPRTMLQRTRPTAVGTHFAATPPLAESAEIARRTRHAPPLVVEGTTLMWPLLAPLLALVERHEWREMARHEQQYFERCAVAQRFANERRRAIARSVPALGAFDSFTHVHQVHLPPPPPTPDAPDAFRLASRVNYLSPRTDTARHAAMSHFYLRPTHLILCAERRVDDIDATIEAVEPVDYVVTEPEQKHYGVPIEHLFLNDTSAFMLRPLVTPSSAEPRYASAVLEALHTEPALESLQPPPPSLDAHAHALTLDWQRLECTASARGATFSSSAPDASPPLMATATAPPSWSVSFYAPIAAMELAPPSSAHVAVAQFARDNNISLSLRRMRLTADREWVQFWLVGQ